MSQASDVENIKPYNNKGCAKGDQVAMMFDNIAPAYDRMNRLMTFGLDRVWLRRTVSAAAKGTSNKILDIATGTADVAIALAHKMPEAHITGIDLSEGMVAIGRDKVAKSGLESRVKLCVGDALALPFADNSFDTVTVAYGVRNFENLDKGYAEMLRVLRPGGRLFVLELTVPASTLVRPFYNMYTRGIIPAMGRLLSKDSRAYSYLPESIRAVPSRRAMTAMMTRAGLTDAAYKSFFPGTVCLYTATKSLSDK